MSGGESSIVQFDNVGLRYGIEREVLSDISFTLYPGSFYFLTGASGAGKTSLLRLLYLAQRTVRPSTPMAVSGTTYRVAQAGHWIIIHHSS